MAELLTDDQVADALTKLPHWKREGNALERTAELGSFAQAIQVVDRVAEIAEAADHHPDMDIRWRTVVFRLSTHSAGGLTGKDVSLAAEIDGVVDAL